jgi:hypothetical protein
MRKRKYERKSVDICRLKECWTDLTSCENVCVRVKESGGPAHEPGQPVKMD